MGGGSIRYRGQVCRSGSHPSPRHRAQIGFACLRTCWKTKCVSGEAASQVSLCSVSCRAFQLCVNITNERLRQHVSEVLFQQEQAECLREGVAMETPRSPCEQPAVLDFFLQVGVVGGGWGGGRRFGPVCSSWFVLLLNDSMQRFPFSLEQKLQLWNQEVVKSIGFGTDIIFPFDLFSVTRWVKCCD